MRIDRRVLVALVARSCHVTPDAVEELVKTGRLSIPQAMAQAEVEIACQQDEAQRVKLHQMLYPGAGDDERRRKHQAANQHTFEMMRKLANR